MENKGFIPPTISQFIDEFYKLFSEYDENSYVGSREQARLKLQCKLCCFIPQSFISKAFNIFTVSGLIEKTDERVIVSHTIGKVAFPSRAHFRYKKIHVSDLPQKLSFIEASFLNFKYFLDELPTEEDIKSIRSIEKSKGVEIDKVFYLFGNKSERPTSSFIRALSDIDLLYNYSRSLILTFINTLRLYNPEEERRKVIEKHNYLKSKEEKIEELWLKYILRVCNLISDCISSGALTIIIRSDRNDIGLIKPNSLKIDKRNLVLSSESFELSTLIGDVIIERKDYVITLEDNQIGVSLIFSVPSSFEDEIDYLIYYKNNKILSLEDQVLLENYCYRINI